MCIAAETLKEELYTKLITVGFNHLEASSMRDNLSKTLKFNSSTEEEITTNLLALADVLVEVTESDLIQ